MARPYCPRCRRPMAWTMYGEYFRCADCDPLPDLLLQRHSIPPEPPQQETMFP